MLDTAAVSPYGELEVQSHLHPAASLGTKQAPMMVVVVVQGGGVLSRFNMLGMGQDLRFFQAAQ